MLYSEHKSLAEQKMLDGNIISLGAVIVSLLAMIFTWKSSNKNIHAMIDVAKFNNRANVKNTNRIAMDSEIAELYAKFILN